MIKVNYKEFNNEHNIRPPSPLSGDDRVRDYDTIAREAIAFTRVYQGYYNIEVKSIYHINDLQTISKGFGHSKFILNLNNDFKTMVFSKPVNTYMNGVATVSHTVLCNKDDGVVTSAGFIKVSGSGGDIEVDLFAYSGHYRPQGRHLLPAKNFLINLGVREDKIKLYELNNTV